MSMQIRLERNFYPIGQGLFCRERFYSEDNTGKQKDIFNLVYDCGSSNCGTSPHKYTKNMMEDLFKDVTIDLLFISHFHADHINLLETINPKETAKKVKKVIIPYLSKEDLILVLSDSNYIPSTYTNKIVGIAADIKDDSKAEKEKKADDVYEKTQYYVLAKQGENDENRNNVVRNGENLLQKLFHKNIWQFIPFNYNFPLAKGIFDNILERENEIKNVNDASELIEKTYCLKRLHREIAKALHEKYPHIFKDDLNEQSTVLFSFTNLETTILQQCFQYKCHFPILKQACDNCKKKNTDKCRKKSCKYDCALKRNKNICPACINQWNNCKSLEIPLGCIYFGDYIMSSLRLCSDIRQNIDDNIAYIGTLQIPHHCSINGLFNNTKDYENKICVIPYGIGNKYGHPCQYVIQSILDNCGYPVCSTNGGGYMQSFVFDVQS